MAGYDAVADVLVRWSADIAEFNKNVRAIRDEAKRTADEVERHASRMEHAFDEASRTFEHLFTYGAAIEGVRKLTEWVEQSAQAMLQLNRAAQSVGMPVDEFQRFSVAARSIGIDVEKVNRILPYMSRAAMESSLNVGRGARAFDVLGISAKDSQGVLRPAMDLLRDVADRFSVMSDGATKTALAFALFGKSGADIVPLLNRGSKGIDAMSSEAEKLGAIIPIETVEAAAEFAKTLHEMETAATALGARLAASLLPALKSIAETLAEIAKNGGGVGGAVISTVGTAAKTVARKYQEHVSTTSVGLEIGSSIGKAGYDWLLNQETGKAGEIPAEVVHRIEQAAEARDENLRSMGMALWRLRSPRDEEGRWRLPFTNVPEAKIPTDLTWPAGGERPSPLVGESNWFFNPETGPWAPGAKRLFTPPTFEDEKTQSAVERAVRLASEYRTRVLKASGADEETILRFRVNKGDLKDTFKLISDRIKALEAELADPNRAPHRTPEIVGRELAEARRQYQQPFTEAANARQAESYAFLSASVAKLREEYLRAASQGSELAKVNFEIANAERIANGADPAALATNRLAQAFKYAKSGVEEFKEALRDLGALRDFRTGMQAIEAEIAKTNKRTAEIRGKSSARPAEAALDAALADMSPEGLGSVVARMQAAEQRGAARTTAATPLPLPWFAEMDKGVEGVLDSFENLSSGTDNAGDSLNGFAAKLSALTHGWGNRPAPGGPEMLPSHAPPMLPSHPTGPALEPSHSTEPPSWLPLIESYQRRLERPAVGGPTYGPFRALGEMGTQAIPFQTEIAAAESRYSLPPGLLARQIQVESNFNPLAVSPAGARGLMQLMPRTARDLGVSDVFNPGENIDGGARYLRQMIDQFGGDLPLGLAAYNAGPSKVGRLVRRYGPSFEAIAPHLKPETQEYPGKVNGGAEPAWTPPAPPTWEMGVGNGVYALPQPGETQQKIGELRLAKRGEDEANAVERLRTETLSLGNSLRDAALDGTVFGKMMAELTVGKLSEDVKTAGEEGRIAAGKLLNLANAVDALKVFNETRSAAEQFDREVANLTRLMETGHITAETYGRKMMVLKDQLNSAAGGFTQFSKNVAGATRDLFTDLLDPFSGNVKDTLANFGKRLARIAAEEVSKELTNAIGLGSGGAVSKWLDDLISSFRTPELAGPMQGGGVLQPGYAGATALSQNWGKAPWFTQEGAGEVPLVAPPAAEEAAGATALGSIDTSATALAGTIAGVDASFVLVGQYAGGLSAAFAAAAARMGGSAASTGVMLPGFGFGTSPASAPVPGTGGPFIVPGTPVPTPDIVPYYWAATGGLITGPGTPTSDSIPVWVSDTEYVIRASAVKKYGTGLLDALNAGTLALGSPGKMPRFAEGGLIGTAPSPGVFAPTPTADVAASAVPVPVNISVQNSSRARVEIDQLSANDIRMMIHEEAPRAVAATMSDANSVTSRAMQRYTQAGRRR